MKLTLDTKYWHQILTLGISIYKVRKLFRIRTQVKVSPVRELNWIIINLIYSNIINKLLHKKYPKLIVNFWRESYQKVQVIRWVVCHCGSVHVGIYHVCIVKSLLVLMPGLATDMWPNTEPEFLQLVFLFHLMRPELQTSAIKVWTWQYILRKLM